MYFSNLESKASPKAIPLAAISGYLIWGETLTTNQILGGILVLSSCIIITLRELKYKK